MLDPRLRQPRCAEALYRSERGFVDTRQCQRPASSRRRRGTGRSCDLRDRGLNQAGAPFSGAVTNTSSNVFVEQIRKLLGLLQTRFHAADQTQLQPCSARDGVM